MPAPVSLHRIAIELVDGDSGAVLSEDVFAAMLDRVGRLPGVTAIDLGILQDATLHPAFSVLLRRAAGALAGRGGIVVVWVAAADLHELPQLPDGVTVAFGLLPRSAAGTLDVLAERFAGTARAGDRTIAGVPLALRPNGLPLGETEPSGGCPIVEQGALFVGLDGALHACQRHLAANVPINGGSAGHGLEAPAALASLRHLLRLDARAKASPVCAACPLDIAGLAGGSPTTYWILRDDETPVASLDERIHLFHDAAHAPNRAVRLDIGCGAARTPGFIGVDRFPLPGVDVVCDLDAGLPFASDSVDYVLASHSLEHLADLPAAITEIFRVCRDRAIVTIISPYHATRLNRANPYHKQTFNEHTARFFTTEPRTPRVPSENYDFPHAHVWGLGSSDHSDWCADLRPLRTEFFYFAPYRGLDEASKRVLRAHMTDVCDQLLSHLLVVKTPIEEDELGRIAETAAFQETASIRARRALEAEHGAPNLFASLPDLTKRVDSLVAEVAQSSERFDHLSTAYASLEHRLATIEITRIAEAASQRDAGRAAEEIAGRVAERLSALERSFESDKATSAALERQLFGMLENTNASQRDAGRAAEEIAGRVAERLSALERSFESDKATSAALERQLFGMLENTNASQRDAGRAAEEIAGRVAERFNALERSFEADKAASAALERQLFGMLENTNASQHRLEHHGESLLRIKHLDAFATRMVTDVVAPRKRGARIRSVVGLAVSQPVDLSRGLGADFQPLIEQSLLANGVTSAHRLIRPSYITSADTFVYPVTLQDVIVNGVDLAVSALYPPADETNLLTVDLCDPDSGEILRSGHLLAGGDALNRPVRVRFDAFPITGRRLIHVRIGSSEAAAMAGLRIFEWRRRRLLPRPGLRDPRLFGRVVSTPLPNVG